MVSPDKLKIRTLHLMANIANFWGLYECGKAFSKSEGLLDMIPQIIIVLAVNGAFIIGRTQPIDKK